MNTNINKKQHKYFDEEEDDDDNSNDNDDNFNDNDDNGDNSNDNDDDKPFGKEQYLQCVVGGGSESCNKFLDFVDFYNDNFVLQ